MSMTVLVYLLLFLEGTFHGVNAYHQDDSPHAAAGTGVVMNIVDYGAVGDGKTVNTLAIRAALEAASLKGGGFVRVPKGDFVTGSFNLTSNVILRLDDGAVLRGSNNAEDYVCVAAVTFDTGFCDYPLVGAVGVSNTGVIGAGSVNGGANDPPGNMVDHYDPMYNMLVPKEWSFKEGCSGYNCRPKLFLIKNSTNVIVSGVSLLNSHFWTVTVLESDHVLFDGVTVKGDRRWPNNDGIDPINTYNLTIQNSFISAGDDGICVVSHTARPFHRLTVKNTTIQSTSAALKLTVFDLTASGDIYDMLFEDITIQDSNRGLAVMPRVGSGSIYDISFKNIKISTKYFSTIWWGSAEPIYVTSLSQSPSLPYNGTVHSISFSNISCISENSIVIDSELLPIKNLQFESISLTIGKYGNISHPCRDLRPCPGDNQPLPYAQTDGWFIQRVDGLTLNVGSVVFEQPHIPSIGKCWNITSGDHVYSTNFRCIDSFTAYL